jgi:cytochrome P450
MFDEAHEEWKYEGFAWAREHCPIIRGSPPSTGPRTIVTRYADVRQILEDPETFSSAGAPPIPAPLKLGALDADPPEHTAVRRLLNPVFTRQFALRFEPDMRAHARELIDGFIDKGEADMLGEFASPFVARILARMVLDETDMDTMDRATRVVMRVAENPDDEGFFDLAVLSAAYPANAMDNPPEREGMLRALVTGEFPGRQADDRGPSAGRGPGPALDPQRHGRVRAVALPGRLARPDRDHRHRGRRVPGQGGRTPAAAL